MINGYPIEIEGKKVRYLTPDDEVRPDELGEIIGFDLLEDRELARHPRVRRVLTTLVRPTPIICNVLHWSDGTDLEHLDRKVLAGAVNDSDFAGALLAEPRTVVCHSCDSHIRVLAVDTGRAMFATTLADRLRQHKLKDSCPNCRRHLGVPVVEFLDCAVSE